MARKVRTQVVADRVTETASIPDASVTMEHVKFKTLESRHLITIGPDHEIWSPDYQGTGIPVDGVIIRLEPPAGITDACIEELQAELKKLGAAAVRVGHRQLADAVITQVEKEQPAKGESVHQVVMGMVEEAKAGDKEALRNLIEAALAAEGL